LRHQATGRRSGAHGSIVTGTPECGISWLNRNRAAATRYDKLAVRCEATVRIAAISEWAPLRLP